MTDRDWQRILMGLREWFPGGEKWAATDGPEAYRLHLETVHDMDAAAVFNAVVALSRQQKFRPSPGEILERILGPAGRQFSDPGRAWDLVVTAVRMIPGGVGDPEFPVRHQAAVDWLRTRDEAVAAWAAQRGLRGKGSLGVEEVHSPEYGGAVLKRLADDYLMVKDQAVTRLQLGRPAFPERAFLVRSTGEGGGGIPELLARLRPIQELDAGSEAA